MLVLSRNNSQTICIGEDIRITVLRIVGSHRVSLGIEAPDDVRVDREEIRALINARELAGRQS